MSASLPVKLDDYKASRAMVEVEVEVEQEQISRKEQFKLEKDFDRALRFALSPSAYAVFCVLRDRANPDNNGWCWGSYENIGDDACGLAPRTCSKVVKEELIKLGLVEMKSRARKTKAGDYINEFKPTLASTAKITALTTHGKNYREQAAKITESKRQKLPMNVSKINGTKINDSSINPNGLIGEATPSPLSPNSENPDESHENDKSGDVGNKSDTPPADSETGENEPIDLPTKTHIPLIKQLKLEYDMADRGDGPLGKPNQDKATVVGKAFEHVFGQKPKFARLGGFSKKLGGGWPLIQQILQLSANEVMDDAHDYLQKVVDNRTKNGSGNYSSRNNYNGQNNDKPQECRNSVFDNPEYQRKLAETKANQEKARQW